MFSVYLVYGMNAEQYWFGDPMLAEGYRKAYELKRELDNETAWLNGMYVFNAVSVAIGNSFGKKGSSKSEYPRKPYDFKGKRKEKVKSDKEVEAARQDAVKMLNNWKASFDRKNGGDK